MITKFLCWLVGHNFYMDVFTGKTEILSSEMFGSSITPILKRQEQPKCMKCNVKNPDSDVK